MNLSEFIKYRELCPFCGAKLSTGINPNRKQKSQYVDGRLVFIFNMTGLKRGQPDYEIGYSFGLDDNSFHIEFFSGFLGRHCNNVPVHLIKKYHTFHKNSGEHYTFTRICKKCYRYASESSQFDFDFRTCLIVPANLELVRESFNFIIPITDEREVKIVSLSNLYYKTKKQVSHVVIWRGYEYEARHDHAYPFGVKRIDLPIIPFVSVEETSKRINNLITFL